MSHADFSYIRGDVVMTQQDMEIKPLPIDENLVQILNRILEQNEMIMRMNERIISVFEPPRFTAYHPSPTDLEKIFGVKR